MGVASSSDIKERSTILAIVDEKLKAMPKSAEKTKLRKTLIKEVREERLMKKRAMWDSFSQEQKDDFLTKDIDLEIPCSWFTQLDWDGINKNGPIQIQPDHEDFKLIEQMNNDNKEKYSETTFSGDLDFQCSEKGFYIYNDEGKIARRFVAIVEDREEKILYLYELLHFAQEIDFRPHDDPSKEKYQPYLPEKDFCRWTVYV